MIARKPSALVRVLSKQSEIVYLNSPSPSYQTISIKPLSLPTVWEDDEVIRQRLTERDLVRQQLLEAGLLVTDIEIPDLPEDWDESDDLLPIQLPPNSKTIADWLEEERGEY